MSTTTTGAGVSAIAGIAVPFDYASVDTDAMFPVSSEDDADKYGYGAALFGRWRTDPEFILNRPIYQGAAILVAGPQFGIGSSRETAVWALKGAGFRAVLAPTFGEIFRTNCIRNGVLTAILDQSDVDEIQAWLVANPGAGLSIDLVTSSVSSGPGGPTAKITINQFARKCLIEGLDEFSLLGLYRDRIEQVLAQREAWAPNTTRVVEATIGAKK